MDNLILNSNVELSTIEKFSYAQLTTYSTNIAESIVELEEMINMAKHVNDNASVDKYSKCLMFAKNNKSTIDYCITKKEIEVKSDNGEFLN